MSFDLSSALKKNLPLIGFSRLQTFGRLAQHRPAVIVGGPVRDLIINQSVKDFDVASTHPVLPLIQKLLKKHRGRILQRSQFMTFTVQFADASLMDIVTARKETYPYPAALPVVKPSELLHDLARRDFSVNAMAISLNFSSLGRFIDPLGGEIDLKSGRLRVLHPKSFMDDPTRIYRAARYSARLGLTLEPETKYWLELAIKQKLPGRLSKARLSHEWQRTLLEKDPRPALQALDRWGALVFLHPGWSWHAKHERLLTSQNHGGNRLALNVMLWNAPFEYQKARQAVLELPLPSNVRTEAEAGLSLLEEVRRQQPTVAMKIVKASPIVQRLLERAIPPAHW